MVWRTGEGSIITFPGKKQQAFATPDADDPHPLGVAPVNYTEWRMDEFAQEGLVEFGHHTAHIRMVDQDPDALEHFLYKPGPYVGHSLFCVPGLYLFEIAECGLGKSDGNPGHDAISIPALSWHRRGILHDLPPGPTCRLPPLA